MLSIRQCVESTWLAHMTGKAASKSSFVTLDTFNSTVELKVRADGPAKVLELIEIDSKVEDSQYPLDNSPEKKVKDESELLDHSNLLTEYDEQKNKKKKELSILVVVESLSLSIVDKEPAELFYFYFHDIQITAHRKMKELSLVRINL